MKKGNVYLGTINIVNKLDDGNINSEVFQQMCPLFKISDDDYANLEWMNGLTDFFQLLTYTSGMSEAPDFVLSTTLNSEKLIYVDVNSLFNFYQENEFDQNVSVSQIKNDWVLDSRIQNGCDLTDKGMILYKRKKNPKRN